MQSALRASASHKNNEEGAYGLTAVCLFPPSAPHRSNRTGTDLHVSAESRTVQITHGTKIPPSLYPLARILTAWITLFNLSITQLFIPDLNRLSISEKCLDKHIPQQLSKNCWPTQNVEEAFFYDISTRFENLLDEKTSRIRNGYGGNRNFKKFGRAWPDLDSVP